MARRIDSLSETIRMLEQVMEPYRGIDTIANFSSALTAFTENPLFQAVSGNLGGPDTAYAAQRASVLQSIDTLSPFTAALESNQDFISGYGGVAQAVSSYARHIGQLGLAGSLKPSYDIDWLQKSGLQEALERNHVFENQIARTLDIATPLLEGIDRNHSIVDSMSSAVMGLSGILQTASPSRPVIADICKGIPAALSVWESASQIDTGLLCDIADRVLSRNQEWTLDSATAEITQEYDREIFRTWHTDAKDNADSADAISKKDARQIDPAKVRDWIVAIIAILEFMLGLLSATGSINISVNSFNTVNQTNNYYVIERGADVDFLNGCCYRIVNRETKVRLKRDCHSAVVGTLHEGQVVMVLDKYKKWIQVEWEDEESNLCKGWIQNYKVSEFVHEKIKGVR